MELSVDRMDVRNFSLSKNVERERRSVSQLSMEMRMVNARNTVAVMAVTFVRLDFGCCGFGAGEFDCLWDIAPPRN